jgi:hypothetical protein
MEYVEEGEVRVLRPVSHKYCVTPTTYRVAHRPCFA